MDKLLSLFSTNVAYAQSASTSRVAVFVGHVNKLILNPIIILMFAASLVYFVYGVIQFEIDKQSGSGEIQNGKNHMIWGMVGMLIMFAVGGILTMLESTLGVAHNPNLPT